MIDTLDSWSKQHDKYVYMQHAGTTLTNCYFSVAFKAI